jgi:hypothetical protein
MKNWKPGHKQTGIGNHLRTQYDRLLLDYERLHPDDLNKDCCPLCQKVGCVLRRRKRSTVLFPKSHNMLVASFISAARF